MNGDNEPEKKKSLFRSKEFKILKKMLKKKEMAEKKKRYDQQIKKLDDDELDVTKLNPKLAKSYKKII